MLRCELKSRKNYDKMIYFAFYIFKENIQFNTELRRENL